MTIPSALTLLVKAFPDPLAQARAIGVFGGCGALANILGVLIGAVFVQWASYHWTFWFTGIIAVSVGMSSLFVIPPHITRAPEHRKSRIAKLKSLDIIGVSILTVAMILFIFAITSGSTEGWADQTVLSTLITSIVLMIGFFYWETLLPVEKVAIPPRTWFYKNFAVLFTLTLLPFFWLTTVFTIFTNLWQGVFNLSAIWTAIHMLPIGVVASAMSLTGPLTRICSPKWIILTGLVMLAIATTLLALGGGNLDQYWTFVFPAFAIGSAGTMLTYTNTNVLLFRAAPASMAGTVGAIFTGGLQMGSAIGLAAVSSIETSIEATHGGPDEYYGRAAAFWLLLSVIGVEIISFTCLYRRKADNQPQPESGVHDEGELTRCETSSEGERHTSTPTKAGLNEGETMAQMT
ncbi:hypothetical protein ID866_4270 [Astraeus odoratus]|nr:hypothetical protein ID866_4270 [Astraeus odoratus]